MTPEILVVFIILGLAILLFVTERIRVDIIALMVMVSLVVTGQVTPEEALSGFSNPAVVTVWAVLMLSGALSMTGVANLIGRQMLKFIGKSDSRLLAVIMFPAAILSGFMNSIGVASLFLPVVIDIAKRTNKFRSKLLIPLSYSALLGGLMTLIGTPPNLLISQALADAGLNPFQMFDFTPIGLIVMVSGVLFIVFLGHRLLPAKNISQELGQGIEGPSRDIFELQERMEIISISSGSPLIGSSLIESRLGLALGLNVIAILREDETILSPRPETILQRGDRLLVEGKTDLLLDGLSSTNLIVEEEDVSIEALSSDEVKLVELEVLPDSELVQKSLAQVDFRQRFGAIVLAIRRSETILRTNLESATIEAGDFLFVQATQAQLDHLRTSRINVDIHPDSASTYNLEADMVMVRLAPDSYLVGKTLTESRLGDAFGLGVIGIMRDDAFYLMPNPDQVLHADDRMLIKGNKEDLAKIAGLQKLKVVKEPLPDLEKLESDQVGLVEAIISPYANLVGKSLDELLFRTKYGLNILAIWRGGRPYRSNLSTMALQFGDVLLLYGPREKAQVLASDPDFIVIAETIQEPLRVKKAPLTILIMVAVLGSVILGWLNIAVAAIAGVVLMVLTRALTMEEAYRSVQWQAIFLIAGMLPLGIAMQKSGAAYYLADIMLALVGDLGGVAVMGGLFLLAALGSQVMPNPAVAVLLAPIAINSATELGISPYPLMMTIAISSSAAFLSPVGHPANVLVMGPGGYTFKDYLRIGIPLTLIVFVAVMIAMPLLWPL